MIIKLCFNLTGKSSPAYKDHDSHGSGLAVLASLNKLGDCKITENQQENLSWCYKWPSKENFLFFWNWKVLYNTFGQNENPARFSVG